MNAMYEQGVVDFWNSHLHNWAHVCPHRIICKGYLDFNKNKKWVITRIFWILLYYFFKLKKHPTAVTLPIPSKGKFYCKVNHFRKGKLFDISIL